MPTKLLVVTYSPSPYQVELFNKIAQLDDFVLTVAYICAKSSKRLWQLPDIYHHHIFLDDGLENYEKVLHLAHSTELTIFNYYQNPLVSQLIKYRIETKKPWCFWGERIGYHQLGFLGTYYRRWKLSALHKSNVPIWGIGNWAIEKYQQEFGSKRIYLNVPYVSNLSRFDSLENKNARQEYSRTFLYSGSLIYRKGVDLLSHAFSKLAEEFPFVRLDIMGEGNLRARLEKQLQKYRDRVRFFGFQDWDNLPNYYWEADILCVPSRYDGWALVVPEGLASGLPVIGTNRTGAALEFILNNKNGWLIPAGHKEALYMAMKQAVLISEDELRQLSHRAKQSVSEHCLENGSKKFITAVMTTLDYFHQ